MSMVPAAMGHAELRHRTVRTNGISMHVAEAGEGPPVVLCHGFPELWYSWRHQLPALAEAGYRAMAPDQRGYGGTDAPGEIEAYQIVNLVDDLTGLLDDIDVDRAVFVGHDWGAIVAWQLALLRPDRVRAVVGMGVPFIPRPPIPPTELLKALAGEGFFYILYFQEVGPAELELEKDPRSTILKTLWANAGDREGSFRPLDHERTGFLEGLEEPETLPIWLTPEDVDYFAREFERTGFASAINWYRNFDRNWELTEHLAEAHVTQPALFITGERDAVARMAPAEVMEGWVDDLRAKIVLPGCGHWTQQERPEEVNRALLEFLGGLSD